MSVDASKATPKRLPTEAEIGAFADTRARMLAAASVGEWRLDGSSLELRVSEALAAFLGHPVAALTTLEALHLCCVFEDRSRVRNRLMEALGDPGVATFADRYRVRRPDGSTLWVESRGSIDRDAGGRAESIGAIVFELPRPPLPAGPLADRPLPLWVRSTAPPNDWPASKTIARSCLDQGHHSTSSNAEIGHPTRTADRHGPTTALERRLRRYVGFGPSEQGALAALLRGGTRFLPAKTGVPIESDEPAVLLLASGWAYSFRRLGGDRRRIVDFHLPGDLMGHASLLLPGAGNFLATVTECAICRIPDRQFERLLQRGDELARAVFHLLAASETQLQRHLVSLGRGSALGRVAELLLELECRLEAVSLGQPNGFPCPLTQELIGDALGLSHIHVNRVLRRLKELQLVAWDRRVVTLLDRPRLAAMAEDPRQALRSSLAPVV